MKLGRLRGMIRKHIFEEIKKNLSVDIDAWETDNKSIKIDISIYWNGIEIAQSETYAYIGD